MIDDHTLSILAAIRFRPPGVSGDVLVRFVYVDEAGTSANDAVAVVAGIVLNPDKQWRVLEERLQAVRDEFLPVEDHPGFVFHAKDVFHGGGYFNRENWPQPTRIRILQTLLSGLAELSIPITIGYCFKPNFIEFEKNEMREIVFHSVAYAKIVAGVEKYLIDFADTSEVAAVYAEDKPRAKKFIRNTHDMIQGKRGASFPNSRGGETFTRNLIGEEFYPIRRIVETVNFAEKQQSAYLQYADCVAFAAKRKLERKKDADALISPFSNIYSSESTWPSKSAGSIMFAFDKRAPTSEWRRI